MTPLEYLKLILTTMPDISKQTGYPTAYLFRIFTRHYLKYRVQIDEFRTLHLYEYSGPMVDRFLLWRRCVKCSNLLNAAATDEDLAVFSDKHRFNTVYRDFVHRQWLYLPDCSREELTDFLAQNDRFLVKACTSSQGENIFLRSSADTNADGLLAEFGGKPFLLESFIRQHPAMSAVNPDSVNTIRLITAKKGEHIQFIGAGLRCGGSGQFVDNFHHGGAAYPIDLDSGLITGHGIDLDGNPILRHPTTGHIMPGFQIPFWPEVTKQVRTAAAMSEHVGYIGWDIAITEDGPELVEGNIRYPGNFIIQLDGPGAWQRLKDLMALE